jgi:hypothetical protein
LFFNHVCETKQVEATGSEHKKKTQQNRQLVVLMQVKASDPQKRSDNTKARASLSHELEQRSWKRGNAARNGQTPCENVRLIQKHFIVTAGSNTQVKFPASNHSTEP